MRVLGIDCGTEYTGYGIVEFGPNDQLVCLLCGAVKLSVRESMALRLNRVYDALSGIILDQRPDEVADAGRSISYAVNVKSALKLSASVRGVARCWLPPRLG